MSAASDAPQPTAAPVKPVRKWTPKAAPNSFEDSAALPDATEDEKIETKVIDNTEGGGSDADDGKLESSVVVQSGNGTLDDFASQEQVELPGFEETQEVHEESKVAKDSKIKEKYVEMNNVEETEPTEPETQEPLTKEQKAAQREANYKQLLENSNAEEEKIGRMLSLMSHASELCATPGTPQILEEQDDSEGVVAEELRIDPLDCVEEEEETGTGDVADEVSFDEGSVIEAEEEHDMIIAEDTLDASFDDYPDMVNPEVSKAGNYQDETNKLNTSIDTVSTVDMTQEKEETSTPDSKSSAGPKRNSRSFSKAKLRFQKRKNVNKSSSSENDMTSPRDKGDAFKGNTSEQMQNDAAEGNVDTSREFNPTDAHGGNLSFHESPDAEQCCSESDQERSGTSKSSVAVGSKFSFYSSVDDEKRSEADHSNVSDGAHSNKFNFYTADSINGKEKSGGTSSDDDETEKADQMKFSFYSSTPIENTSLSDDSITKDVINSSFLADGDKPDESDQMGFYTSKPMNMESFDGSEALANDGLNGCSSTNTTSDESEVHEVEEGFDGDYVDRILNDASSYTTGLNDGKFLDGSSRSFVSFREKKRPGSRNIKASDYSSMLAKTDTIDTAESENTSPRTVVDSLHAKSLNASSSSPLMKKYQLGRSLDVTASTLAKNKASTSIFTKKEIESITSGQIAVYLTLEERKSIGTKVLSEKMMRGYSIAVSVQEPTDGKPGSTVCDTCDMPMLTKSGKLLESCVICPVLKKKTLKRILNPVHDEKSSSELTDGFQDAAIAEARNELLDVSKRKSYYERSHQQEHKVVARAFDEGRNAVQYARDVLSDRVTVADAKDEREGNEKVQPRILFPDDLSVEVVQDDGTYPLEAERIEKTPSSSVQASNANGRPPLAPQFPASVKSKTSRQIVAQNPNVQVVASSTAIAIQKQIEDTKGKLLNADDPKRQMLYSDLLNKLNGALIAVEQLEEISKQ